MLNWAVTIIEIINPLLEFGVLGVLFERFKQGLPVNLAFEAPSVWV